MKYNYVIFDLDGTVLDTLEDLADSVNYALKKNSLPERTLDEIRSFVGNGIRLLTDRAVPESVDNRVRDAVFEDFKEYYKEHNCDKTKSYDGIVELLKELKASGVRCAVVSNKADFAVKVLINRYFDGLFDFSVGEREGIEKKPAPDSVFEAMKKIGASKSETVYVGDSQVDIMTAKNADIDCICVDWGFRNRETLINAGADVIVSSPKDILESVI